MNETYVALKALIVKDRKYLIIKRSPEEDVFAEEWDLPGGKVNFGELPLDALKREVEEETGIGVNVIRPVDVWSFFKNDGKTQVVGITFLCNYAGGGFALREEHTNFKWISKEEIAKYKVHKGIKDTFKKLKDEQAPIRG